jgi:hypothetical protein
MQYNFWINMFCVVYAGSRDLRVLAAWNVHLLHMLIGALLGTKFIPILWNPSLCPQKPQPFYSVRLIIHYTVFLVVIRLKFGTHIFNFSVRLCSVHLTPLNLITLLSYHREELNFKVSRVAFFRIQIQSGGCKMYVASKSAQLISVFLCNRRHIPLSCEEYQSVWKGTVTWK